MFNWIYGNGTHFTSVHNAYSCSTGSVTICLEHRSRH
jgi:hypothetical protein